MQSFFPKWTMLAFMSGKRVRAPSPLPSVRSTTNFWVLFYIPMPSSNCYILIEVATSLLWASDCQTSQWSRYYLDLPGHFDRDTNRATGTTYRVHCLSIYLRAHCLLDYLIHP